MVEKDFNWCKKTFEGSLSRNITWFTPYDDGWDGLFDEDSDYSEEGFRNGLYCFWESKDVFLDSAFLCNELLNHVSVEKPMPNHRACAADGEGELSLPMSLTEMANGDCVFLQKNANGKHLCSIYSVRPLQCRTWPFWSNNLKSTNAWAEASLKCPGMNNGRQYSFDSIEELRLKKSW